MADKLKSCTEYFVKVKYIDYVKESIENGDAVETIVFHILDKEGTTYAESWEMADHMDDFILAIASELGKTDYVLPMMRCSHSEVANSVNILDTKNKYYISINAKNNLGVIGNIGKICEKNNISVASIMQHGVKDNNTADITMLTEFALEKDMRQALKDFEESEYINKINSMIRVQG